MGLFSGLFSGAEAPKKVLSIEDVVDKLPTELTSAVEGFKIALAMGDGQSTAEDKVLRDRLEHSIDQWLQAKNIAVSGGAEAVIAVIMTGAVLPMKGTPAAEETPQTPVSAAAAPTVGYESATIADTPTIEEEPEDFSAEMDMLKRIAENPGDYGTTPRATVMQHKPAETQVDEPRHKPIRATYDA